ncbi:hypothetical protein TKK_0006841 [Trichogramma kaykai]|uniref:Snurportin-1 n=1 Tax=Trichogramma kaykai TaxID=54128 RepID=A0ABD2XBS4_9HYME
MATSTVSLNERSDIHNEGKREKCNERAAFYKKPINKHNVRLAIDYEETPQETRRRMLLDEQKKNRNDAINSARGILEDIIASDDEEVEMKEVEESEDMEVDQKKQKHHKLRREYGRLLMLSEWMSEVPEDFSENWVIMPCPIGKRVVIIAGKGTTRMFTRKGEKLATFRSLIPGGGRKYEKNCYTVLDGVWSEEKSICYILDSMAWSDQQINNCEAEFRFFWLKSKIEELSGQLKEKVEGVNEVSMKLLPTFTSPSDLSDCLENTPDLYPLDGILFFHKEGHYFNGKTPLVTWLKVYMLPEVFGISIPEQYDVKPEGYIDYHNHILKEIAESKSRIKDKKMEVA